MGKLTDELIRLHGKEGLRAEQWFELLIDDVLAGFGIRLTEIPSEAVREVLFNLSGLYAREVIEARPFADLLGPVHMDLVSRYHQKGSGQFFTPEAICQLMARLTLGDAEIDVEQGRLTRVCDPAVGAGALLLGVLAQVLESQGPEALPWISLTGIDIDGRCARMYPCQVMSGLYIHQLSLGELVSYQGNALIDPADWQTVCHYSRADLPAPIPADLPAVKQAVAQSIVAQTASPLGEQLMLF